MVGVSRIGLLGESDRRLVDEAGQIVDVPVGVVAGDPAPQPEDLSDPEVGRQAPLDLLAGQARVAGLNVISRHSSVASIVPAPLTSMAPPSRTTRQGLPPMSGGLPLAQPKAARDLVAERVVLLVVGILPGR